MNRNTDLPNTGSYDPAGTRTAGLDTSSAQQPGVANTGGAGSGDRLGMHDSTTAGVGRTTQSDLSGNTPGAGMTGSTGNTPGDAYGGTGGGGGGNSAGASVGEKVKGLFAQGHGAGESLRGNINAAIDSFTGDKANQARNEDIARGGIREMDNREFERKGEWDKTINPRSSARD